jgi:hypothetical protein
MTAAPTSAAGSFAVPGSAAGTMTAPSAIPSAGAMRSATSVAEPFRVPVSAAPTTLAGFGDGLGTILIGGTEYIVLWRP